MIQASMGAHELLYAPNGRSVTTMKGVYAETPAQDQRTKAQNSAYDENQEDPAIDLAAVDRFLGGCAEQIVLRLHHEGR